ncbi:MAG TPA: hypothetical protein VLE74_02950 [Candidatus Saccharimonadales bacterium]|nr:hypothetical protein [Candidatus Saccharimonadales bacterium]
MTIHSITETKPVSLVERRTSGKFQGIMKHLGDMMISAPYRPGHENLGRIDSERMAFDGWRLSAPWLDTPAIRATIDIFGCVSRPTCFRVVHSEHAPAPEKTEIEISRQEFDIDFNSFTNAEIHHLPDPALLAGEPRPQPLHGEDAWKELQRVIRMSAVDD